LKEKNTYGLLCGEKKDGAPEKYPELVAAYENDEPVLGYESHDFFLQRVRKLVELLPSLGYETLICVTHGKLLKALINDIVGGREAENLEDSCIIEIELDKGENLKILNTEGVFFK
jgi:broad specificity phosphatase PhoE